MKYRTAVCALILSLCAAAPALAAPHVIVALGSEPLLGKTKTAPALRLKLQANAPRLRAAAGLLGIDPAEYLQIEQRLKAEPVWVVVPRHLDGMAWYSHGTPRVEHDVIIPASTYGWEAEVNEGDQTLDVYLPASCGNLSIIRKFRPHLAHVNSKRPVPVAVAASAEHAPGPTTASPLPAPASTPANVTAATPSSAAGQPANVETPAASVPAPPAIPPVVASGGHFRLWPLLAALGLSFWFSGGGGGHQTAGATHTPPPVICPP